ncbi:MAG: hypothetical protein WCQ57_03560 [Verrucomicrobiota bacterium]
MKSFLLLFAPFIPVLMVSAAVMDTGTPAKTQVADTPAAPSVLPEKDPAPEGAPVTLQDSVRGKHPRLFLTAEKVSHLKDFYKSSQADIYREQLLSLLPGCVVPASRKMDMAWGQEIGIQNMPSVALHYVATGDKGSLKKCVDYLTWLVSQPDWTTGGGPADVTPSEAMATLKAYPGLAERNSDTTAAFTMVGVALTYDWLYNDLAPELREQVRQALWAHARFMYYGGHLSGNPRGDYWRGVPMYNHRWFRDWGLALATLAVAEGKPEEQWLLGKVRDELKFMADWLPLDGSQHEGPDYGASAGILGCAFQVSDECLGTRHLRQPYFQELGKYAMALTAPGMQQAMYFSDCGKNGISYDSYFLKTAADARQLDVLDGLRHDHQVNSKHYGVREGAWMALLFDNKEQVGGDYDRLPVTNLFPDSGIVVLRDSWKDPKAVAALFKCGPPGGYKLNAWAQSKKEKEGKYPYVNVAHDHPNANSFTVFGDGDYLAETDRYCDEIQGKRSSSLNTILINGMGQMTKGRAEGELFLQPASGDMTGMGRITAWKDAGEVVLVEGEAAGSYLAYTDPKTKESRPGLDRFRRTFIWVRGGYILVLDDVRAPEPVKVTWLMQGAKLVPVDASLGIYNLSKNKAECNFQLVADTPIESQIGVSTANVHGQLLNWQQLQANAHGKTLRFVSLFDPWHHKDLKLSFTSNGPEKSTITVVGNGVNDTWEWQAATGKFEASTIHGSRQGGFSLTVDAKTAAPPPAL